jgi:valyl-tRNA synthetase
MRVTGRLRLADLTTMVSADAVARWLRAGGQDVQWRAAVLAGDLGGQRDMELELAREGLDRASLGREAFVERVRTFEAEAIGRAQSLLDELGVQVELASGVIDQPATLRAARTAFVRLYEAGRLFREERVVTTCPSCETVVDPAESELIETKVDRLVLRLPLVDDRDGESIEVGVAAPELLPGAVAIAVPVGHPVAGQRVELPVAGRVVPVVPAGVAEPTLVVPAHDADSWELARQLALPTSSHVLGVDGTVRVGGPLEGLPRYAARERATALLAAGSGTPLLAEPVVESSVRCRRCGTELVPQLGRHWFLTMADVEVTVADAIREGRVTLHPATTREELIAHAGQSGPWCLSRQVWAGHPVPVATCLDCGRRVVAVEPDSSCGTCMGTLAPDEDVLDARFLAAVWPLAAGGWPDTEVAKTDTGTTVFTTPVSLLPWALPSAAVGLAVAGAVPFTHIAVVEAGAAEEDLAVMAATHGRAVVRAALLAGGADVETARAFVSGCAEPARGDADLDHVADLVADAYHRGAPGRAATILAGAVAAGIGPGDEPRTLLQRLAVPILGG